MARERSASKNSKKKKSIASLPPPPPPTLIRVDTPEDFALHVSQHQGSALLAIVSPLCPSGVDVVVPYLEKLNDERPASLKDTNLVVLYAMDSTRTLCEHLAVSTLPSFASYSYGELVSSFHGDNVAKAELIAKMAAQKAMEEAARLEAEKKAQEEATA